MSEDNMARKSDEPRKATQAVPLQVRMPEELRSKLSAAAERGGGSMNSEIISRLEQSLELDSYATRPSVKALLVEIARQIARIEDATGHEWDQEAAVFRASEVLIRETVRRVRPAFMDQEARTLLQQQEVLMQRRRPLVEFLQKVGALGYPNALAAMMPNNTAALPEMPEDRWHNPNGKDDPLTDEERTFIAERVAEYREVQSDIDALAPSFQAMTAKFDEEKATAATIYRTLTGHELPSPLVLL